MMFKTEPEESIDDCDLEHLQVSDNKENHFNAVDIKSDVIRIFPIVSDVDFSGPHNFNATIPHQPNNKWMYSSDLHKLFILVRQPFPIDFKLNPVDMELYIRATLLYSAPQFSQQLVKTCMPHSIDTDGYNENVPQNVWQHVLRCQDMRAIYKGGQEDGKHLSVIVPLGRPPYDSEILRQMYLFVCQNSCPTGINRKAIQLVFTLEDATENILGRKCIDTRVCSSPKRDKMKEENSLMKNAANTELDKSKEDFKEYTLKFPIRGKHNAQAVLHYAYTLMCAEAYKRGDDKPYRNSLKTIKELLDKPLI